LGLNPPPFFIEIGGGGGGLARASGFRSGFRHPAMWLYFNSLSELFYLDSDRVKSFVFFRIQIRTWIRIRNTVERGKLAVCYYVVPIRIQQKVSDFFGFVYGFRSVTLMRGGSSLRNTTLFECLARKFA
jgi:hypothetical protein